jgi:protein-S-isoprenylcysteine O-methyltransferase Ste14
VVAKDDARRRSVDTYRQAGAEAYYTRNPGYLALAAIYSGIAFLRSSLWAMLLLPLVLTVIQREVIGREERYLERTFGEEYLDYKGKVRRWI